jgi:hypothetical protein
MKSRLACALVLALAIVVPGCQSMRLYAKDLLYHPSAAVSVPSWTAAWIFVAPPTLAWLPVSGPVLAIVRDEGAIWFALAPGILIGAPLVYLFGSVPYLFVGKPEPEPDTPPPGKK